MNKHGILLVNLGTPDDCSVSAVSKYLREFLQDPRVIDLPFLLRWLLVNAWIVPMRSRKSAEAYQKIWQAGSPLLKNSEALKKALSFELGDHYQVELGMRYGNPSIESALQRLQACAAITVLPLFPQYSSAATGSAIASVLEQIQASWNIPALRIIRDFYDHPGMIAAYAQIIKTNLLAEEFDLLLFSYHGLPERHINKSECHATCDKSSACPTIQANNLFCYRAQCYATSHLLAKELGLATHQYAVSFQSRLGATPWIKPYTDILLPELHAKGIKNLAIVCPSFVADCLETLEEINIRAREAWHALGGQGFTFIPCLNAHPAWVKAVKELILTADIPSTLYRLP